MDKKIGSSLGFFTSPNFKAKVCTFDKKNPTTIYFEGGTYITPAEDKSNYYNDVKNINADGETLFKNEFKDVMNKKYIYSIEIAIDRIEKDKPTFYSYQIHIKPQNEENADFTALALKLWPKFEKFLDSLELLMNNMGFTCSKTK